MFPCVKCKTEQGLLRHMSAKHVLLNNVKFEKDELMVLIKGAASKLASDDCFPSNVRYCLRNITFDSEEVEKLLEQYTEVLETFHGNGNFSLKNLWNKQKSKLFWQLKQHNSPVTIRRASKSYFDFYKYIR